MGSQRPAESVKHALHLVIIYEKVIFQGSWYMFIQVVTLGDVLTIVSVGFAVLLAAFVCRRNK